MASTTQLPPARNFASSPCCSRGSAAATRYSPRGGRRRRSRSEEQCIEVSIHPGANRNLTAKAALVAAFGARVMLVVTKVRVPVLTGTGSSRRAENAPEQAGQPSPSQPPGGEKGGDDGHQRETQQGTPQRRPFPLQT